MTDRLAKALEIAREVSQVILPHFHSQPPVELKADKTPVTIADKEAESFIRERLNKAFPGEAILGEEEGLSGSGDSRWVIDPIDGTKSFICGVPLFATLIAYEQEGKPILGIAHFPALGTYYYAETGGEAFKNDKPCTVSKHGEVSRSVISCAGHKGMNAAGLAEGINRLSIDTLATRTWCDAYGHCLVAAGQIEAMIDPTLSRWDISALIPIINEAGGRATDRFGNDPITSRAESEPYQLISSNGVLHDELLEYLNP